MDNSSRAETSETNALHPGFKPRRSVRQSVEGHTGLSPHNLYKIEVRVRDLSTCGFMAECAEPVLIGSYVELEVPGIGPVNAQVRWQLGIKVGGMFLDPISLTECDWVATKAA